jgi:hypothetical protein
LINEQYHLLSENLVSRVVREGDRVLISSVLVTREDLKIPVEGIAAPVRNMDGWIIGVVIVVHDVNEKHRV